MFFKSLGLGLELHSWLCGIQPSEPPHHQLTSRICRITKKNFTLFLLWENGTEDENRHPQQGLCTVIHPQTSQPRLWVYTLTWCAHGGHRTWTPDLPVWIQLLYHYVNTWPLKMFLYSFIRDRTASDWFSYVIKDLSAILQQVLANVIPLWLHSEPSRVSQTACSSKETVCFWMFYVSLGRLVAIGHVCIKY